MNAANAENNNDGTDGYDYGLRVSLLPFEGWSLGFGVGQNTTSQKAETFDLNTVADVYYTCGNLGLYVEYISIVKTVDGVSGDNNSGLYFEGSYIINDRITAYAGMTAAEDLITSNRIVVGGKYKLAEKTTFQGEYVSLDEEWKFDLRLKLDF